GVGKIGPPPPSLYSETLPPTTGTPSARQASPRPAIARVSCQAMCGFSGLPKLRQLVSPSGSAPTQARLAEHSSTASTAPRYGSAATRRPLPSIATAIAGRAPSREAGQSEAGSPLSGVSG